jgi:AcrR family transcriptional regulator
VIFVTPRRLVGSPYADRVAQCAAAEAVIGPLRTSGIGALDAIDDEVIQDRERFEKALHHLLERLLGFAHGNPDRQRLYVMRWLEPPDELRDWEAELTLRLYNRLAAILRRGQELGMVRGDLDLGYFIRSFDWLIFSYFVSGAFSWQQLRTDPLRSENLEEFRKYLFDYTKHMLEM